MLDSGITHTIRLPDGEELRLRFFACETFTLQVLAIFERKIQSNKDEQK